MWCFALAVLMGLPAEVAPSVGVIADDLIDYSQWAAPHKALWAGSEITRLLSDNGVRPTLLKKDDLTLEEFSRFDAILIATDHTYPEHGSWGGPISKALVEYVQKGGIYAMPIGIPHWTSKDLDTGKLDNGHFKDFFGFTGMAVGPSNPADPRPLLLTRQGRELGLPEPAGVHARPARTLDFPQSAVLVWSPDYIPCLSVVPFGKGWLIHWGAGPEGGMDQSVRDWLVPAQARLIRTVKQRPLRIVDRRALMEEEGLANKSLDDLDRQAFNPGPAPFDRPPVQLTLSPDSSAPAQAASRGLCLDGKWQMLGFAKGTGDARKLIHAEGWDSAVPAQVPCSVQTALFAAGKIPDPTVGFNDVTARAEVAEKEWWFRRDFAWDAPGPARLVFDGVDYSATFYLNGVRLGEHEGPFGGPTYDVTGILRKQNTLVVRLDPLPPDWKLAFKTNCVYGWHYVNCPPIGIWRSVRVEPVPVVEIGEAFVAATKAETGTVDLHLALHGPAEGFAGRNEGRISPANFDGKSFRFTLPVKSARSQFRRHLRFNIPQPRLWWPVDLGDQPLYRLDVSMIVDNAAVDTRSARFGIRTIEMRPLPGGPFVDKYNWTFCINGRPTFLKGCNWCTVDAFLRLDEHRYRRFLTLARDEHIQIMRSWGGGLLETDTFYDLCDELGIMVWQEFPLTWQNFDVLRPAVADEIAWLNIHRLRNHPSLALWCGGNEHHGRGPLIELLGRRCLELDGTRPFHRTDPYGGSIHDYGVYWGKSPFEHNINLVPLKNGPPVIGELGAASACALESTLKFLPEAERNVWPPPDGGAFVHHTPTFTPVNMEHLNRHAKELDRCETLATFTPASQLAQAVNLRIPLERMRVRWPEATAMVFYKLTDVYPGCSWSTVDYYGVPKIAHYFVRNAFGPLHACALYESFDVEAGKDLAIHVFVLDDLEKLTQPADVRLRLFDARLCEVAAKSLPVSGPAVRVRDLGQVKLPVPAADAAPLLLAMGLRGSETLMDQSFYWFNFRSRPGCLFDLPKTTLAVRREGEELVIENTGDLPAVAVHVSMPEASDSLRLSDGYFWLDAHQSRRVKVDIMPNIGGIVPQQVTGSVAAWNAEPCPVRW